MTRSKVRRGACFAAPNVAARFRGQPRGTAKSKKSIAKDAKSVKGKRGRDFYHDDTADTTKEKMKKRVEPPMNANKRQ